LGIWNVEDAYRQKLVAQLREMSEDIRKQPGFFNDERLRAAFITVLTLQGAMMFKDEVPLSHLLHDFCKERSDLLTLSN
jgi:hypothetical protein